MNEIIYIFIFSFFFQIFFGIKRFKSALNPITLINVIFLLHNWIYSLFYVIDSDLVATYPYIPDDLVVQEAVLRINLIGLWCCFLCINIFYNITPNNYKKNEESKYDLSIYKKLYFIFYALTIVNGIIMGQFTGVYGADQALTAREAFSPIRQILLSRIIFAAVTILDNRSKKTNILILILELIYSILFGGRKALIIVIFSFLVSNIRFKVKYVIPIIASVIVISFLTLYISQYRFFKGKEDMSFLEKNEIVLTNLSNDGISHIVVFGLISANSEYLQSWVYEEMKFQEYMYGKTYFQALVNTVIPRPFQGEIVDWQAAYVFKRLVYHDVDDMGYDFTFTAEAIMNFGAFSFIPFCILGAFLGIAYKKSKKSQYWYLLYMLSWPILTICLRTDSVSLLRWYSFFVISFFILKKAGLIKTKEVQTLEK